MASAENHKDTCQVKDICTQSSAMDLFLRLAHASSDGIAMLQQDGRFCFGNTCLRRLIGVGDETGLGEFSLPALLSAGDRQRWQEEILPALQTQGEWRGKLVLQTSVNNRLHVQLHVFLHATATEAPEMMVAVMTDITQRETDKVSVRIGQAAIETSLSAVAMADLAGHLTYVNPAFLRLWRMPDMYAVIGRSVLEFWTRPEQAQLALDTLLREGSWQGELEALCADGSSAELELSASTVRDASGQPICLMGTFIDLTARNAAKRQLQRQHEFASSLLRMAPMVMVILNLDGSIHYINPFFERMSGFSLEEVQGRDWIDTFIPEREQRRIRRVFKQAIEADATRGNVNSIRTRDGRERIIEWNDQVVKSVAGSEDLLLAAGVDVTEREQHAQQLQQWNEVLERSVTERTDALSRQNQRNQALLQATLAARDEAERANTAKSEFLSRMSHELRTPLNAILGFGQLLQQEDSIASDQMLHVREIMQAGQHLLQLVNDILDLAKVESGRLALERREIAVQALVDGCVAQIRPVADLHGIDIRVQQPFHHRVWGDELRLKQVLFNLLSNAIKYNREAGQINISFDLCHEAVRITVADTGIGISPDQLSRLFQPFERLVSAYQAIEGTGIGLALAKQLVEAMDGRIGVNSIQHNGSRFWIELPCCQSQPVPLATEKPLPDSTALTAGSRFVVLYIEDNTANLRLVRKLLEKRNEIDFISASNGESGLELMQQLRPNLILLDINLPGMDGYAVFEKISHDSHHRNIPVVALSANAMPKDVALAKASGFSDYLTKPINIVEFFMLLDRYQELDRGLCQ